MCVIPFFYFFLFFFFISSSLSLFFFYNPHANDLMGIDHTTWPHISYNSNIKCVCRLTKAPIQQWTTFMEILKAILHQKAHTFQLKMFATYPNTIQNCAIKDRTASIKRTWPHKKWNLKEHSLQYQRCTHKLIENHVYTYTYTITPLQIHTNE